jgi:hypothetical protein
MRYPALDGSKLDLSFAIVIPVPKKSLSDGADVAGITNTFKEMLTIKGYCVTTFHVT